MTTTAQSSKIALMEWAVIPLSPFRDPWSLARTRVTATCRHEAWEFLLDAGGWPDREMTRTQLLETYEMAERSVTPIRLDLTRSEWIEAVMLGYQAAPVHFCDGAMVQKTASSPPPTVLPAPKVVIEKPRKSWGLAKAINRMLTNREALEALVKVVFLGATAFFVWKYLDVIVSFFAVLAVVWIIVRASR